MSLDEFIEYLRSQVETEGEILAYANKIGVSNSYVADVLRGRRKPGKKLLDAVGFERIEVYRRKGGDNEHK